ncbi:uncharacterized protein LOC132698262 [Cylas formicarius]|uniref:uncharacterized protein LOC132698262 n=1 Tax=Cylas formicarius TaxID=197179 RepID=UPI002958A227|nr:uncharacterized protein LOC132698262 [Cylas formicarius]
MASLLVLNGPKRIFRTVVGISIWTLVQSFLHLSWIIYSYYSTICKVKPSCYDIVFIYLTYFYNKNCGSIDIKSQGVFFNNTDQDNAENGQLVNHTVSEVLYTFLKATLENATLPETSPHLERANTYLLLFIVADVIWITTALFLLVGAFIKLEKYWFLISYGPYLVTTAYIVFLDVVSAVHFGLDMVHIHSYSTWLKFIGAVNYKEFEYFNVHNSSKFVTALPPSVMATLFSRFFIAWIANVLCFFIILFLLSAVYPEKRGALLRRGSKSLASGLSTSEARIRNWQQFYGAVGANSTMASANSASGETYHVPNLYTDLNSNENENAIRNSDLDSRNTDDEFQGPSHFSNHYRKSENYDPVMVADEANSIYNKFLGVEKSLTTFSDRFQNKRNKDPVLRGHIPWSYIKPQDIKKRGVIFQEPAAQSTRL